MLLFMKELAFQQATKIMKKSPLVYSSTDTVSMLIGGLYETNSWEALVSYEGRIGLVTLRDLLGVSHPERTLIKDVARSVPSLSTEATVLDAVELMISNRIRAIPILSGEEICGILSEIEVMNALPKSETFGKILCEEVMKEITLSINVHDKISTARSLMREHGVDYLLVLNRRGLLSGVITVKDIVFNFIQPKE
ncbi:MAG TPA: CBS domain-containing protein, partial [Nitrososphaeria archaeon]|nr:CBS domain-containing protein [Nitrososphaeria archaeon]